MCSNTWQIFIGSLHALLKLLKILLTSGNTITSVMLVAGINRVLSHVSFVPSGVEYIGFHCSRKAKGGKECIPKGCGLRLKASI